MADTSIQREAARWVCEQALPARFGQSFSPQKWKLTWGGVYQFDALSADGTIVASISTSGGDTVSGKFASGKVHRLKSNTLYLLHASGCTRRLLVLTDPSMHAVFEKEQTSGRFPPEVELVYVTLPDELKSRLDAAKKAASDEMSPR